MPEIRFQYDREKAVQAIAYMAQRKLPELSTLKVCKLLYFVDKRHLLTHARPVLGDNYVCMEHGPVPSASYELLRDVLQPVDAPTSSLELFTEFVGINHEPKYPEFVTRKPADLDVFSPSELEALNETLDELGQLPPWKLRDLSHDDPAWKIPEKVRTPGSAVPIRWEYFFDEQPADVQELLSLIRDEQEQRDFALSLSR